MDLSNSNLLDINSSEEFSNMSISKSTQQATGCKKPIALNPLTSILTGGLSNLTYKKKKKEYEKCLANAKRERESEIATKNADIASAKSEAAKAKAELEQAKADKISGSNVRLTDASEGMAKSTKLALWISGGVVALGLISFVVYKIVKK